MWLLAMWIGAGLVVLGIMYAVFSKKHNED